MNIEELMRNDWVKISKLPIYCQVKYFTEDGKVVGIEIACCGDAALMALVDSLGFAMEALMDECE